MPYKNICCLLPLLIFYFLVCYFVADNTLVSDETRYAAGARNLSHGFYASKDSLELWSGPGYSLFLVPFAKLKIPWVVAKCFNSFLVFGSVCFVFASLRKFLSTNKALLLTYIYGFYPPLLPMMPKLLTESLGLFLVAGLVYFILLLERSPKLKNYFFAGLFCAFLMLTKVFFAYVIAASLFLVLVFSIRRRSFLKLAGVFLVAYIFCSPYLFYTWSLTGKVFCWANSGGSTLYWMANPEEGQWGSWVNHTTVFKDDRYAAHQPLYKEIMKLNAVERDEFWKKKGIENLVKHPDKYLRNWISNVGRLWLDYPYTYKEHRPHTLFYMFPNAFLLALCFLSACVLFLKRRQLPTEIFGIGIIAMFFLSGSTLIFACSRYLTPLSPALTVLITYTLFIALKIEFRDRDEAFPMKD